MFEIRYPTKFVIEPEFFAILRYIDRGMLDIPYTGRYMVLVQQTRYKGKRCIE